MKLLYLLPSHTLLILGLWCYIPHSICVHYVPNMSVFAFRVYSFFTMLLFIFVFQSLNKLHLITVYYWMSLLNKYPCALLSVCYILSLCFVFYSIISIMLPCLFNWSSNHFHVDRVASVNLGFVWDLAYPVLYSDHFTPTKQSIRHNYF